MTVSLPVIHPITIFQHKMYENQSPEEPGISPEKLDLMHERVDRARAVAALEEAGLKWFNVQVSAEKLSDLGSDGSQGYELIDNEKKLRFVFHAKGHFTPTQALQQKEI